MRTSLMWGLGLAVGAVGIGLPGDVGAFGAISGFSVVSYTSGSGAGDFTNPNATLGAPAGDTGFGAQTPFNPAFSNSDIVIVGAGGSLTLRLSSTATVGAGADLGVFTNNGIIDVSNDGSGVAGNPAATFSAFSQALVSVSASVDANSAVFVPLSATPFTFDNPTNAYTDTLITNYFAPVGNVRSDEDKPFVGNLSSFDGKTYGQMLTLLDGSAGGSWLDVSLTGLSTINFVRFDVPVGASYRLVLDSVSAVPEPAAMSLLMLVSACGLRRR